eukprot:GFKZ01007716.1.p1 GENE.GFKZ01007716.1~~GFKZ01007716.1.p1  ORF type:complete len:257 (+),score=65.96 GFKZ01007716.1:651-1421(+)
MTTAHRATWKAARGGLQEEGSYRLHVPSAAISSKDAPTEQKLKFRQSTDQNASREKLRAVLESDEKRAFTEGPARKRSRFELPQVSSVNLSEFGNDSDGDDEDKVLELDRDVEIEDDGRGGSEDDGEESDREEESDDESDDDEAELLAELERIRRERESERAKRHTEEQEKLEREETERAAAGNPLLGNLRVFQDEISDTASIATGSMPPFAVKRRWDDDVVFRNQAKNERKVEKRFINDTTRNDFHRRFMKRYMR